MRAVNTPWPVIKNHSAGSNYNLGVFSHKKTMDNKIRSDKISLELMQRHPDCCFRASLSPETFTPSAVLALFSQIGSLGKDLRLVSLELLFMDLQLAKYYLSCLHCYSFIGIRDSEIGIVR